MKRRIIRASELTDNSKGRADRVAEAYDLLKDLEYKLADLSDEFWTLTPTDSWKRINNVLGYVTRARNQIEKVDVSEDIAESCKVNADTVKKKSGKWVNRGDTGKEHGEFDTKKEADAQRKAMYATGYKG